jgi:xylulokinase
LCYIASFDIGTTQVKGILLAKEAIPILEKNIALTIDYSNNRMEQDPVEWYLAIVTITAYWWEHGISPENIQLITFSGQMQDCIPIQTDGSPVRSAILYGDSRAGKQAASLAEQFPIRSITGNHMDGTLTFPKMVWMKEEEPQSYQETATFLISSKDYVIRKLTGRSVTDPTTAATTGMMNAKTLQWEINWLEACGLDLDKLSAICPSDEVVGYVTEDAANQTGFRRATPVLCGIGDGGSATIGAGVFHQGEMYAYLGTTGWIATPVAEISSSATGLFHLPYLAEDSFLAIAPIMNAGNAHKWANSVFGNTSSSEEPSYESLETMMQSSDRQNNQLLFLPYLNGERCPIQDPFASGCFIGIRSSTTAAQMSCAVLEGVAMAMRQVMELLSTSRGNSRLTLIGGGSKSNIWNQIIADVFNKEVSVPQESQLFPAIGAAVLGVKKLGWESSYSTFAIRALSTYPSTIYKPDYKMVEHYNKKYAKYSLLYGQLKDIFR